MAKGYGFFCLYQLMSFLLEYQPQLDKGTVLLLQMKQQNRPHVLTKKSTINLTSLV
jgi:5-methylcytosine-specific restriction endonuclease McrBC regulatory subunit McrC